MACIEAVKEQVRCRIFFSRPTFHGLAQCNVQLSFCVKRCTVGLLLGEKSCWLKGQSLCYPWERGDKSAVVAGCCMSGFKSQAGPSNTLKSFVCYNLVHLIVVKREGLWHALLLYMPWLCFVFFVFCWIVYEQGLRALSPNIFMADCVLKHISGSHLKAINFF